MFGIDDALLVGLAGSAVSGGLSLFGQGQQQQNARDQLQLAQQNYLLQQRQADLTRELATAGREDARGNRTIYVPGVGWKTITTPTTAGIINASDAQTLTNLRNQATRGEADRSRSFNRRLSEGSTANPLLEAVARGYGAPTREAVGGRNLISNVTQAAENTDALKSGYAGAALRTGQGTVPLALNMQSANKGGTAGIRSALARSDAETDPLFNAQMQQWREGKLNPYNMLATRAGNSSDMPFQPENLSAGLDAANLYASGGAAKGAASGSESLYRGIAPLIASYGAQRTPDYEDFSSGLTANLKELFKKNNDPFNNQLQAASKDWSTAYLNPGAYNNWRF